VSSFSIFFSSSVSWCLFDFSFYHSPSGIDKLRIHDLRRRGTAVRALKNDHAAI